MQSQGLRVRDAIGNAARFIIEEIARPGGRTRGIRQETRQAREAPASTGIQHVNTVGLNSDDVAPEAQAVASYRLEHFIAPGNLVLSVSHRADPARTHAGDAASRADGSIRHGYPECRG